MRYFIEKHFEGYCIRIGEGYYRGMTISTGEPHNKSTMYFKKKKLAEEHILKLNSEEGNE